MAKEQAEDLTGAYDPRILKAIKLIGQGLMDLADALIAPDASAKPDPRPADRSQKHAPPPAEEPDEADEAEQSEAEAGAEEEEIKLADLQKMAKNLIKGGGRDKLLKILEALELDNVSSAPTDKWAELKEKLEAASS